MLVFRWVFDKIKILVHRTGHISITEVPLNPITSFIGILWRPILLCHGNICTNIGLACLS